MNKKRILLVDDDLSISDLYKERLEMEGFEIIVASNGSEAIKFLSTKNPDLILLDIMMPQVGGLDVLDVIRSKEKYKNIPVIMLTALIDEEPHKKSLTKGADDYIIKTKTKAKELVEKIKTFLLK